MQRFTQKNLSSPVAVFAIFWSMLFLLYLPAARCGWVSDTLGWLDSVRHQSFPDYINRTHFGVHSFYQTTQFVTWCLYRIFGANRWAWHIIHLSLHAANCTLLYHLCAGLLRDNGIERRNRIAFGAALLFCTSPYVSEVIVWEASFHYLQGVCFMLTCLILLRRFLHQPRAMPAIAAGVLFLLAAFSLELFYLIPLFTATLLFYYRVALQHDQRIIRRAACCFLLPQLLLFTLHLSLVHMVYGTTTARLGDALLHMSVTYYAIKPPDYFFHLLGGRFLPQAWRSAVHQAFCTYAGAGLFYLALVSALTYIVFYFRKMPRRGKLTSLFFLLTLLAMALVTPMWFPERMLILGDRYLYIMLPFFFTTAVMLLSMMKSNTQQFIAWACVVALQCGGTFYLNRLWQKSLAITDTLLSGFHPPAGKTVLLLNNPASLKGAPMIGAGADGELKLMHILFYTPPLTGRIADVLACDLTSASDSVDISILSDSAISVRLLRPGSRWWYGPDYARSYVTPDYAVQLRGLDTYILTLKGDPQCFVLMYGQRGIWKTVNMYRTDAL